MEDFLKIKKRNFVFFLLLFFNQFFLNGYTSNLKKIDLGKPGKNNHENNLHKSSPLLLSENNKDDINITKKEAKEIKDFAKEIEDFLEETYDSNNFYDYKNKKNKAPLIKNDIKELEKKSTNKDDEESKSTKEKNKYINQLQEKEVIIRTVRVIREI